ncbi:contractile injection system tape measure protein [Photorhabdus laumondii]
MPWEPNLFKRITITIEANNSQVAKKVLHGSLLHQVGVCKLFDLYFNKYDISHDIYLEKLTLNLGEINSPDFNSLFPIRLNAALNKSLSKCLENNQEKTMTENSIIPKNVGNSSLLQSNYLSDIEEFIQYLYQKDIKLNHEKAMASNRNINVNAESLINQLMRIEKNLTLLLAKSCLSEHGLQRLLAISQPDLLTAINRKLSENMDRSQHQGKVVTSWQLVLNALGYIQRHNIQEIPKPDMKVISYIMAEFDSRMLDIMPIITLFRQNIVAENTLLNEWLKPIWQIEWIPKLCKKHLSVQEYKNLINRFGCETQTLREQSLQQIAPVNSMITELLQGLSTAHRGNLPPLSQHQLSSITLSLITTAIQKGEIKIENIIQLLQHPALYNQTGTAWLAPLWQLGSVSQLCKKHLSTEEYSELLQRFMPNNRPNSDLGLSYQYQISNAGILILWPMLPILFNQLSLLEAKKFIHQQAQFRAVDFLDYLIWGDEEGLVERKTLNKVLCGLMIDEETQSILVEPEKQLIIAQWLDAIIAQLPGWKKLSRNDVRQLFLQRPGELLIDEQEIKITLQHQPFDLLLADWPWPLNIVKLPWLNCPLQVDWKNI